MMIGAASLRALAKDQRRKIIADLTLAALAATTGIIQILAL